jgi:fatty acid synthase subunit beta
LTQVLNDLSREPSVSTYPPAFLRQLVKQHNSTAPQLTAQIVLQRGVATIPLSGIDVPFHSTYLRDGIGPYRRFLEGKILPENIDPDKLVDRFIPNVTGKPFSVDREYVQEVAEITGSESLRDLLSKVRYSPS